MPDKARFAAFQDLLTCGVADEIDLILSVRIRDMIVYSSFDEEAYGEGEFACGIAGSPGVAEARSVSERQSWTSSMQGQYF